MPQSLTVGLLVLGGVLLLIAVTGGNFKLFAAEVDSPVSNPPLRILSGVLGLAFILLALLLSRPSTGPSDKAPVSNSAAAPSPSPGPTAGTPSTPAVSSEPSTVQPIPALSSSGNSSTAAPSQPDSTGARSGDEYGLVFDPPTNIRTAPTTASPPQCSVTSKISIRLLGMAGNWYKTDFCGSGQVGYIYRNQLKF